MLEQVEDLVRAGIWLGPSVLGALCYRLVADVMSSEDFAGAVMLATSAILLTAASLRFHKEGHRRQELIVPLVFAAMFVVSWSMR